MLKFEQLENTFLNLFDALANRFADLNFKPNYITIFAFIFAILAGISFYLSNYFLLPASIFAALNAILDLMDGMVAKKIKQVTKRGEFLDHMLDRFSDTIILLGISFSDNCNTLLGLLAAISVLLVSYSNAQGQAVGVKIIYKDLLGKEKRYLLYLIIPIIQFLLFLSSHNKIFRNFTLLDFLMLWFIIAGIYTTFSRSAKIWKSIKE